LPKEAYLAMKQIQDFEYQEYVKMKEQKEHMVIKDYAKEKGYNMWRCIIISNLFAIIFGFGVAVLTYAFNVSLIGCIITSFMGAGLGFYIGLVIEEYANIQLQLKYFPNKTNQVK